jgi:hypothetical protein
MILRLSSSGRKLAGIMLRFTSVLQRIESRISLTFPYYKTPLYNKNLG